MSSPRTAPSTSDGGSAGLAHRRVVVKVGTNLLTGGGAALDAASLQRVAADVAAVRELGGEAIVVSSGAIQAGRERVRGLPAASDARRSVVSRQALAAIGQGHLMSAWSDAFEAHGVTVAQALLTRRDLADRLGYLNARNTLHALLAMGVLPIVNENDVVAVDEIRGSAIGDNDNLSALVANLVDADLLVLLTDIDGLYTADPSLDASATLIERVEVIDDAVERVAGTAGERGTGGMVTKLQAARVATQSGTEVVIASGLEGSAVLDAACGRPAGTRFTPRGTRLESRRRFLLSGLPVRGRLRVDDGAARALAGGGRSLLPAGIVEVEGTFERGDVVEVRASDGRHLASGAVNYGAEDIARIRGLRSDRIVEVLGYEYGDEVIHANNLALA